jgi:hypothetical protein
MFFPLPVTRLVVTSLEDSGTHIRVLEGSNNLMGRSCRSSQDSCPPALWLPVQDPSTLVKHLRLLSLN